MFNLKNNLLLIYTSKNMYDIVVKTNIMVNFYQTLVTYKKYTYIKKTKQTIQNIIFKV